MTLLDPQHNYGSEESESGDSEDADDDEDSVEIDFEEFCIESQIANH